MRAEGAPAVLAVSYGNRPYRGRVSLPVIPKALGGCTGCGLCAAKCPVGAIAEEKPKRTDKKKCISCMRCIEICPNGARGCSPLMEDLT